LKLLCLVLCGLNLLAQRFSQSGFVDVQFTAYPQTAPNDSGRAIAEALLRYEPAYRVTPRLRLAASFDLRTDSHRQTERDWGLSWQDRELRRPAFEVRRLSAIYLRGRFTAELGKQLVHWGRAEVANPTDRFAPRDLLSVVSSECLGVTAARITWAPRNDDNIEVVYAPRFTPSRTPLFDQRWVVLAGVPPRLPVRDGGALLPGGPQAGIRWDHAGGRVEYSLSFYQGFQHMPSVYGWLGPNPMHLELARFYPKIRMFGGDVAVPLSWLTLKAEAAYFTSREGEADNYLQYVFEAQRHLGEWALTAGYIGEAVTSARRIPAVALDRVMSRTFLGRAEYTIDVNRRLRLEGAVRQSGDGVWLKAEYSKAVGQHWRATASFTVIRGALDDFLGQYRRNSNGILSLRYNM
jgi:hypothetical protein